MSTYKELASPAISRSSYVVEQVHLAKGQLCEAVATFYHRLSATAYGLQMHFRHFLLLLLLLLLFRQDKKVWQHTTVLAFAKPYATVLTCY